MSTSVPLDRASTWPVRAAYALTTFLLVSGIIMMALPHLGDQFLGMLDPEASRARSTMIGVRQFEYGLLLVALLRSNAHRAAGLAIRLGGLIPLADACIAYSQTGIYTALPHLCAALAAQVLASAMARIQTGCASAIAAGDGSVELFLARPRQAGDLPCPIDRTRRHAPRRA